MRTITIRGIDKQIAARLKKSAKDNGTSVNQYLLECLRQNLGLAKKKFVLEHNDLDHLFGKWSEKEYAAISITCREQRKIDSELWK